MQSLGQAQQAEVSTIRVGEWAHRQRWPLMGAGVLVLLLYLPCFRQLISDWWIDENYSHGFLTPIVFVWLLWQRRGQLGALTLAPQFWGLGVIALAALQLAAGTLGAEHFVAASSLLLMLAGIAIYLFGPGFLRQVLFPIGWLLFMIPLPAIIFYSITFPMQLEASRWASHLLDLLRVPNLCEGNVIYLPNFSVGVVEACSGIRSLITLLAVAVLVGPIMRISLWGRGILVLSAVPIALGVNAARIAFTGVIGNYVGPQWAEGFYHTFAGWLLFLGAFVLILVECGILRRLAAYRVSKD